MYLILGLGIALFLVCVLRIGRSSGWQGGQLRQDVYKTPSFPSPDLSGSESFIYYEDFEEKWVVSNGRNKSKRRIGFKYQDGSGCYVVTIYKRPVKDEKWSKYENIYIGQSIHVCQRVHNHFNGKGNGYIYADILKGRYVYVHFVMCPKEEMNELEKRLIQAFNATDSYNRTRGGSVRR